jgi:hypothetical protein
MVGDLLSYKVRESLKFSGGVLTTKYAKYTKGRVWENGFRLITIN